MMRKKREGEIKIREGEFEICEGEIYFHLHTKKIKLENSLHKFHNHLTL